MTDLAQLSAAPLVALASRVRRIADGHAWTTDAITTAIVQLLFDELGGSLALVRAYRGRRARRADHRRHALRRPRRHPRQRAGVERRRALRRSPRDPAHRRAGLVG